MAEFVEVMKQAKRMCAACVCEKCPLCNAVGDICTIAVTLDDKVEKIESIVMDWAEKNPEPRYPTWVEWWSENFRSDGRRMLTPCSFVPPAELGCSVGMDGCMNAPYKCWHTPIPANTAERLGIKPIGGTEDEKA